MTCPCGQALVGFDDTFIPTVRKHLTDNHPGHEYDDDQILMFASSVSDDYVRQQADG
ncbi:hypothetical protein QSJ18_17850 [Gordonia sp. ABSL1-1]|uniref:hypothetical protein n=1 Tax=Gordonia sp. ABSL1-1 TaxID=3053923 RepID=UPI002572894D|nr:hypothetical protein [Gordonia sp. ABSL1-1]MDL9938614.1 hypothetical protein [Gordonia sp. ABSL1-1]